MALRKFTNKFTQTPNEILNLPGLSLKEKGLWTFINSKPDGWDFSIKGIASQNKDGRDSVSSGIQILEEQRYLKRVPRKDSNGHWDGVDYHLYLEPYSDNETSKDGKSVDGERGDHSNKDIRKKEEEKKKFKTDLFEGEKIESLPRQVLRVLNESKPGKSPFHFTRSNLSLIEARVKEGFVLDDFKRVIFFKIAEWKDNEKMKKYIRPATFFGSKFDQYVVESKEEKTSNDGSQNFEYKPQEKAEMV